MEEADEAATLGRDGQLAEAATLGLQTLLQAAVQPGPDHLKDLPGDGTGGLDWCHVVFYIQRKLNIPGCNILRKFDIISSNHTGLFRRKQKPNKMN